MTRNVAFPINQEAMNAQARHLKFELENDAALLASLDDTEADLFPDQPGLVRVESRHEDTFERQTVRFDTEDDSVLSFTGYRREGDFSSGNYATEETHFGVVTRYGEIVKGEDGEPIYSLGQTQQWSDDDGRTKFRKGLAEDRQGGYHFEAALEADRYDGPSEMRTIRGRVEVTG